MMLLETPTSYKATLIDKNKINQQTRKQTGNQLSVSYFSVLKKRQGSGRQRSRNSGQL